MRARCGFHGPRALAGRERADGLFHGRWKGVAGGVAEIATALRRAHVIGEFGRRGVESQALSQGGLDFGEARLTRLLIALKQNVRHARFGRLLVLAAHEFEFLPQAGLLHRLAVVIQTQFQVVDGQTFFALKSFAIGVVVSLHLGITDAGLVSVVGEGQGDIAHIAAFQSDSRRQSQFLAGTEVAARNPRAELRDLHIFREPVAKQRRREPRTGQGAAKHIARKAAIDLKFVH